MTEITKKISTKYFGIVGVGIFLVGMFLLPNVSQARTNVIDWYIQDFTSQIVVNTNSTLDINETIVADCGNAVGKHGIFRILPTSAMVGNIKVAMPVELVNITDQSGQAIQYAEKKDTDTVTWQIGNPKVTVNGVHTYKIHYRVRNVMRFDNPKFDELYWNLNGNFWDLQIDHFRAEITFPEAVNSQNATVDYYTGALGSKSNDLAIYRWKASNVLEFESTKMIDMRQGITASIIFPKNIIMPYQLTFWEKYGKYFFLLVPIVTLIVCFQLWLKYGKDPRMDKTIIPEYEVPGNLSPIELGMLEKSGGFDNKLITAEIIFLATKGLITIEETHEKLLFLIDSKDYKFIRKENQEAEQALNLVQKKILSHIFEGAKTMNLSDLKKTFYAHIPGIKDATKDLLQNKGLVVFSGLYFKNSFRVVAGIMMIPFFMSIDALGFLSLSFLVSAIFLLLFSFVMPKRTPAGAEMNWQVAGFKLFMETVDKDRAEFYEKENIFEKFLPYAIVFDMTELWAKRMQEVYGQEFYSSYIPAWYVGNVGTFNVDSFSDTISNLSASIAANTSAPSSSGSGGFGGSGGGGGGGGGGGW
jgi:uncharacterized membrane protein